MAKVSLIALAARAGRLHGRPAHHLAMLDRMAEVERRRGTWDALEAVIAGVAVVAGAMIAPANQPQFQTAPLADDVISMLETLVGNLRVIRDGGRPPAADIQTVDVDDLMRRAALDDPPAGRA